MAFVAGPAQIGDKKLICRTDLQMFAVSAEVGLQVLVDHTVHRMVKEVIIKTITESSPTIFNMTYK